MLDSRAMFSSASPHWTTPENTYAGLDAEFAFTMDPCPLHADFNGLEIPWVGAVFVNPPYGRGNIIVPWIKKGWEAAQAGALVVLLLPSRTDTRWWHEYVMKGEIRFIQGRLHFSGTKFNAPFPSAVVVFYPVDKDVKLEK